MTVQDATTRILLFPGKPLLAKNSLKKNIRVLFQIRKITGMHFKQQIMKIYVRSIRLTPRKQEPSI